MPRDMPDQAAAPPDAEVTTPRRRRVEVSSDGRRIIYYTGHPPPLRQVAAQVRTVTGYTAGRSTVDGPALRPLPPMWRPAPRPRGA